MTSHDRLRIATHALVYERTVIRVYKGGGTAYSRLRVSEGAKALGLPLPQDPSTASLESSPEPSPTNSKAA